MTNETNCPFGADCDLQAQEDFEQSGLRQFFRAVYCKTHGRTFNETLRVAGYFRVEEDGLEGAFLPGVAEYVELPPALLS